MLTVKDITHASEEAGIVSGHDFLHQDTGSIGEVLLVDDMRSPEIIESLLFAIKHDLYNGTH